VREREGEREERKRRGRKEKRMERKRESLKEVLMRRDGLREDEANQLIEDVKENIRDILESGGGCEETEEIFCSSLSLEPDYLDEVLFDLY